MLLLLLCDVVGGIFMPKDANNMSKGFAFVEFFSPQVSAAAASTLVLPWRQQHSSSVGWRVSRTLPHTLSGTAQWSHNQPDDAAASSKIALVLLAMLKGPHSNSVRAQMLHPVLNMYIMYAWNIRRTSGATALHNSCCRSCGCRAPSRHCLACPLHWL
eukprot:GHRQ01012977.1.p1 GENE.GHRQ01012977.1~~GHRQ01012977.1.p1  ORF type:complete len:158 (-),score=48.32 GHRQ01012977.1:833-1306(-)